MWLIKQMSTFSNYFLEVLEKISLGHLLKMTRMTETNQRVKRDFYLLCCVSCLLCKIQKGCCRHFN